MPRWATRKKGREGRAHIPGKTRQPLPPRSRRQRRPARRPPLRGQRKRAAPPPATARPTRRPPDQTPPTLGRPRLRLQALEQALRDRQIEPQISKRRRAGDPIPHGTPTREVWRGRHRHIKTADPQARHRWPVERTNAWLKAKRRINTRRDRKADNYLAFLHLAMILVLTNSF